MSSQKITTFRAKNGTVLFPRTHSKAVLNDEGTAIVDELSQKVIGNKYVSTNVRNSTSIFQTFMCDFEIGKKYLIKVSNYSITGDASYEPSIWIISKQSSLAVDEVVKLGSVSRDNPNFEIVFDCIYDNAKGVKVQTGLGAASPYSYDISVSDCPIDHRLDNIAKECKALDNRVKALENGSEDSIPDYYREYMNNKASIINKQFYSINGVVSSFAFITDVHYYRNQCNSKHLLKYLLDKTYLNSIVCGGDVASARTNGDVLDKEISEHLSLVRNVTSIGAVFHDIKGNHDYGGDSFSYPNAARVNHILQNEENVMPDGNVCAYYYDDNHAKIRYIVYDSSDHYMMIYIQSSQLQWICNSIINKPTGFDVVFIGHASAYKQLALDDAEYSRLNGLKLLQNAYANKENFSFGNVAADFRNTDGELLLTLTGHIHLDCQSWEGGSWKVSTLCDTDAWGNLSSNPKGLYEVPDKIKGTTSEQAFDVVTFDKSNRIIYFNRIGGGYDRTFNMNPINVSVGGHTNITSKFTNAEWLSYDAEGVVNNGSSWSLPNTHVSVSGGVVSGINNGISVVVAMDSTGNKEFFCVKSGN